LILFIAIFIVQLLGGVVLAGLFVAPLIAGLVGIVLWICYIALVILWVIGIINALSGKEKPLPVIGGFANKINL